MNETKELILRDIYYSPRLGYRSAENLYQQAIEEDETFTRKEVQDWLKTQASYTKFKKFLSPKHFRHTIVRDLGEQAQVDLVVFLSKHSEENDNYKYFFVGVEILSRYAFAYPLRRKDGASVAPVMRNFLESFHARFHSYPKLVQFDEGSEFLNKDVKPILDSHDITYFSTVSRRKAAVVERLNRTLKAKILKMFEKNHNHNWISYLHDIVENYNDTPHRSIGMEPNEVDETNKYTVWGRLYGHIVDIRKPKFSIGDKVRVLHFSVKGQSREYKKYFETKEGKRKNVHMVEARDKPPFSNEIFEIIEVLLGDPVVYKLYSPEAKIDILGKFYEEELSLVTI